MRFIRFDKEITVRYSYSSFLTRPVRLGVRTPPFHGGNTGSNPVPVTIFIGRFCIIRLKEFAFIGSEFFFWDRNAKKGLINNCFRIAGDA